MPILEFKIGVLINIETPTILATIAATKNDIKVFNHFVRYDIFPFFSVFLVPKIIKQPKLNNINKNIIIINRNIKLK